MRKAEYVDKWKLCNITNAEGREGNIPDAIKGSMLSLPFPSLVQASSCPNGLRPWPRISIVFACANPVPEIWPWEAKAAGAAVVATGRSDFDNQVNNSLGFPSAPFRYTGREGSHHNG